MVPEFSQGGLIGLVDGVGVGKVLQATFDAFLPQDVQGGVWRLVCGVGDVVGFGIGELVRWVEAGHLQGAGVSEHFDGILGLGEELVVVSEVLEDVGMDDEGGFDLFRGLAGQVLEFLTKHLEQWVGVGCLADGVADLILEHRSGREGAKVQTNDNPLDPFLSLGDERVDGVGGGHWRRPPGRRAVRPVGTTPLGEVELQQLGEEFVVGLILSHCTGECLHGLDGVQFDHHAAQLADGIDLLG